MERYRRIRDLREDHDLTQAQVGAAIQVSQRTYAYYESGQRMIPPEIFPHGMSIGLHQQDNARENSRRRENPVHDRIFHARHTEQAEQRLSAE